MTVEAPQMSLLPPNMIRDFKPISHLLNNQIDSGRNFQSPIPWSFLPLYQSSVYDSMNTNSGPTYNQPAAGRRKRRRDSVDCLSPIDDGMIFQIQQNQSEIDRFVAKNAERVAVELGKRRRQESRMVVMEIYKKMATTLREKDDEIQRRWKLNLALQERMKSLCVENQLWRDLAQTKQANANMLRNNLEQVLAHVSEDRRAGDAESSCGSSGSGRGAAAEETRKCRRCGDRESCVLVLPCRHLSLCTACGSTSHTCPLCHSVMNATVHVNLS